MKRREAKSKGENERYQHLNAEFRRIARRDKKAFFSNQCKEIEEKNTKGKTRCQGPALVDPGNLKRGQSWSLGKDYLIINIKEIRKE